MRSIKQIISNPLCLGAMLVRKCFKNIHSDSTYLKILYFFEMKHPLHLKNPRTFTEKLQWLKINNRKQVFTTMVDKFAVKQYVSNIIGKTYIIPTLGIWNRFDEIDFDSLPNKFVLKTTHGGGSGGVVICHDKTTLDKKKARIKLESSLSSDIYSSYREWPYRDVPRRIIAEKLIEIPGKIDLKDYKFFCFNGEPKFLKVDFNRFIDHHANYYDLDWNLLPFGEIDLPPVVSHEEQCPPNFDEMVAIARRLSKDIPFLRVDLYNCAGKIYFGELTFFPASGFGAFTPKKWDEILGNLIVLSDK